MGYKDKLKQQYPWYSDKAIDDLYNASDPEDIAMYDNQDTMKVSTPKEEAIAETVADVPQVLPTKTPIIVPVAKSANGIDLKKGAEDINSYIRDSAKVNIDNNKPKVMPSSNIPLDETGKPDVKEYIRQKAQNSDNGLNPVAAGLTSLFAGLSGRDPNAAVQNLKNVENQKQLSDPTSNESTMARSLLQRMLGFNGNDKKIQDKIPNFDNLSASQINTMFPAVEKLMSNERIREDAQTKFEYVKNQKDVAKQARTDAKKEKSENRLIDLESRYRNELKPYTKTMMDVDAAYRKVKSSANSPSAAGDLSLIFNYMKMLDPGSVVREGEFATAQNTAGIDDRIRNAYNKALKGERLSDTQRNDFTNQANKVYQSQYESYNNYVQPYKQLSEKQGLDYENIDLYKPIQSSPKKSGNQGQPNIAKNPEGKVKIQLPNGKVGFISKEKLQEALADGAKVIS